MVRQEGHSYSVDYWTFGIFLYEMLVGQPPFMADSRNLLYEKIKKGDFPLPVNMDTSAKDILKRLLQVNVVACSFSHKNDWEPQMEPAKSCRMLSSRMWISKLSKP